MSKSKLLHRITEAQCSASPTGTHRMVMEWRGEGIDRTYWGVCRDCGHEHQEDANLGLGMPQRYRASNSDLFKKEVG